MRYTHTNIVARDWKKLAEFYMQVFGCTEKPPERHLAGEWLDKATGLQDAHLHGIHLLLPGHRDTGPTLEIFSYETMHETGAIMANHTGFTHIAFEVDQFDAVYTSALEAGATALGQPTRKTVEGVGVLTFVYCRDPEGNIVEIQSWEQ